MTKRQSATKSVGIQQKAKRSSGETPHDDEDLRHHDGDHVDAPGPNASSTSDSKRPTKKQKTTDDAVKPHVQAALASDTKDGPADGVKPAVRRRGRPRKNVEPEDAAWEVEAVLGVRYASDSTEDAPRFQYAVKWAGAAGGETSWWTPESLQNDQLVLLGLSKSIANGNVWFENVRQPKSEDEGALVEPESEPEPELEPEPATI